MHNRSLSPLSALAPSQKQEVANWITFSFRLCRYSIISSHLCKFFEFSSSCHGLIKIYILDTYDFRMLVILRSCKALCSSCLAVTFCRPNLKHELHTEPEPTAIHTDGRPVGFLKRISASVPSAIMRHYLNLSLDIILEY